MIRILLKTVAVLSLLLWGVNLFASEREEAVAPWESAEEGRLWSGRVISDTFSNTGGKTPLNALCDETAFETIKLLREKAVSKLRHQREDRETSSVKLFAGILKNISEIDIVPLKEHERELLVCAASLPISVSLKDFISAGKGRDREIAFSPPSATITNSHQIKNKVKNKTSIYSRAGSRDLHGNVNLEEYSLKAGKIDLYGLYLYIWEDNPFTGGRSNIFSHPVFSPRLVQTLKHITDPISFHITVNTKPLSLLKGAALCHVI